MNEQSRLLPSADDFDRMEQRLFTAINASDKTRSRRKRLLTGGAALLLIGGSATTWAVLPTPGVQQYSAYCYVAANTSSHNLRIENPPEGRVPSAQPVEQNGPADPAAIALEQCASAWRTGAIEQSVTNSSSGSKLDSATAASGGQKDPVPRLQICVRDDHAFAVFPRAPRDQTPARQFCAMVGLEPPTDPESTRNY